MKPCDPVELRLRVKNLLETRFLYAQLQSRNESLEEAVRERTEDLEQAQIELAARLGIAAEYRDDKSGQHAARVGRLAALIASNLDLPNYQATMIGRAAPLHDVGKIGVPDAVLLKPEDELTPEETATLRAHTVIGARMLGGSRSELLRLAEAIALYHHEHWDGTGYGGVRGEDIPLCARITAVADAFDTVARGSRRRALPVPEARNEIRRRAGTQFDAAVVEAFLRITPAELSLDLALIGPREMHRRPDSLHARKEACRRVPLEVR